MRVFAFSFLLTNTLENKVIHCKHSIYACS